MFWLFWGAKISFFAKVPQKWSSFFLKNTLFFRYIRGGRVGGQTQCNKFYIFLFLFEGFSYSLLESENRNSVKFNASSIQFKSFIGSQRNNNSSQNHNPIYSLSRGLESIHIHCSLFTFMWSEANCTIAESKNINVKCEDGQNILLFGVHFILIHSVTKSRKKARVKHVFPWTT